jgi:hypothetical protein
MNIPKNLLLPLGIGFAVAVPIAVNHDEAYLDHKRTGIQSVGEFQREHVLGNIAIGGLIGGAITATALKRGNVGAFLGAAALGVTLGTLAGHFGWDQYLARAEHQDRGARPTH